MMQGEKEKIFKVKDEQDAWMCSIYPDFIFSAKLQVDRDGAQVWNGKNGSERIVRADGTVETTGPDKARQIIAPDRSFTRTVFALGNDVSEATAYRNGDVEVLFDDGSTWLPGAYSDAIVTSSALSFRCAVC